MKKSIITILLALALAFSLGACSNKEETYEQAKQFEAEHRYLEAIELYESVGDFEDATERAEAIRQDYGVRLMDEIDGLKNFEMNTHESARNYFNNNRANFPLVTEKEIGRAVEGEWHVISSESLEYNLSFNSDGTGTIDYGSDLEKLSWVVAGNNFYYFEGGELTVDNDGVVWYENSFGNKDKCDYISEVRKAYENIYITYIDAGTYGIIVDEVWIRNE